jgi:anaerobic ribonucleoside-triphosphate reductase activating protein|nr:MAG TPA: anaerobic ribonucleoside-triphosphate reductase activating protein [Bacteriophage sp.]DAR01803.1 MAG TPA: anaerobic ribonucleoside-triphosphate reductase activating protein [Crassvirales sp.]
MKYVDTKIVMQEIPDEVTLAINISNCPCHCKGCHSSYLAEDIGTDLTFEELLQLCSKNTGITCVSFMGGDSEPSYINKLAEVLKEGELPIRTAWYSGRDTISNEINLENFDYIKVGRYDEFLGPLNSRTTNQRLYKVIDGRLFDITNRFWNED